MKRFNLPLIIGSLILILVLAVIIFPRAFTDKSPYNMQKLTFSTEEGSLQIEKAPYPPSKDFIMGSDEFGRDIYSFIIYGTGMTILLGVLIAIGRFLIAVPMAMSAGFGNNTSKSIIRQFNILFSAIPALLISVIILKLEFFAGLDKTWSVIAFVIVLSTIGWPKIGSLIMERAETVNRQAFIKSEVAIGKGRLAIAIENVFPHLAPELIVLFFMEIARALSMIMQLGIFSVFVGLLRIIKDTEGGVSFFNVSFEPEWAGMLSTSRSMISVAPWTVLFPALAFFVSVLGFNLFGEGLRNILQKRDSMFIPGVRKLLSFNFKQLWVRSGKKTKIIFISLMSVILVMTIALLANGGSKYHFEQNKYRIPDYDQVIFGTDAAAETAGFIALEMQRLGIKPLQGDEYTVDYTMFESSMITEETFLIFSKEGEITAEFETDYCFEFASEGEYSGRIYDATGEDLFNIDGFEKFKDKFVMIDKAFYNNAAIQHFIREISENSDARGILLVNRTGEKPEDKFARENHGIPILAVTKEFAGKLRTDGLEISISVSLLPLRPEGVNIIGIYEGAEGALQEEAVLIGLRYNYLNAEEKEILKFNLQLMEHICSLEKNNRSIIFMFIDGTHSDLLHGITGIAGDYPYSASKSKVFIDLTGLEKTEFEKIKYSSAQAPFTRQYAWSFGHQLDKAFKAQKIGIDEIETIFFGNEYYFTESYVDNTLFFERGVATIIIGSEELGNRESDIYDLGGIILDIIKNNNY